MASVSAASVASKSVTSHGWNEPPSAEATSAPSLAGRSRTATRPPPATMRSAVAFAIPEAPPTAMVRNPCRSMEFPSGGRGAAPRVKGEALQTTGRICRSRCARTFLGRMGVSIHDRGIPTTWPSSSPAVSVVGSFS